MQITEAIKLPFRASTSGEFFSTAVYALPNQPGIYRRVSRDGRCGLKPGDGNTLAIIPAGNRQGEPVNGLCELVRWREGEEILRPLLPGVESPISDQEGKPF